MHGYPSVGDSSKDGVVFPLPVFYFPLSSRAVKCYELVCKPMAIYTELRF